MPQTHTAIPGCQWPAIPAATGSNLLAMLFQLEYSQWQSPQSLRQQQFTQLEQLLIHARQTTAWYRDYPDPLNEVALTDRWSELPVLARESLQENMQAFISGSLPKAHGRLLDFSSTGSTGAPVRVKGSDLSHFFSGTLLLRDHLWHRRELDGRLASIRSTVEDGEMSDWGGVTATAFQTGACYTLNIRHDVREQLDWLLEVDPHYLISHPSNLHQLLLEMQRQEVSLPALRQVRSFGELLLPETRALCQSVLGVGIADVYSTEEVGSIALQCPEHGNLHIQSENLLVEIVDEEGQACAPGQIGRVVVTPLHNFAMPLIRYAIGDYAEWGEACPCGRGLPVLKQIMGRRRNMLHLPDGSQHWPSFPTHLWQPVDVIRQLRLEQVSLQAIEIHLRVTRALQEEEEGRLVDSLTVALGHPFAFRFVYDFSTKPWTGKREDFISHLDVAEA